MTNNVLFHFSFYILLFLHICCFSVHCIFSSDLNMHILFLILLVGTFRFCKSILKPCLFWLSRTRSISSWSGTFVSPPFLFVCPTATCGIQNVVHAFFFFVSCIVFTSFYFQSILYYLDITISLVSMSTSFTLSRALNLATSQTSGRDLQVIFWEYL